MPDIRYFNLGFRCENSVEALKGLKKGGYTILLEGAKEIINDYQKAISTTKLNDNYSIYREIWIRGLKNLSKEGMGKEFQDRTSKIDKTGSILEKIINKEKVSEEDIESSINFFQDLSEKCLSHNIPPHCW